MEGRKSLLTGELGFRRRRGSVQRDETESLRREDGGEVSAHPQSSRPALPLCLGCHDYAVSVPGLGKGQGKNSAGVLSENEAF